MLARNRDALVCDMAETYGVYDIDALPVRTLATLAAGLRADSRSKSNMEGINLPLNTYLLAAILDRIGAFIYMLSDKTTDPPGSVLNGMLGRTEEKELQGFESGEDFDAAWKKMARGE